MVQTFWRTANSEKVLPDILQSRAAGRKGRLLPRDRVLTQRQLAAQGLPVRKKQHKKSIQNSVEATPSSPIIPAEQCQGSALSKQAQKPNLPLLAAPVLIKGGKHLSLSALPTACAYWPINQEFNSFKLWNPFAEAWCLTKGRAVHYRQHLLVYHPWQIPGLRAKAGTRNSMATIFEFILILHCQLLKKVSFEFQCLPVAFHTQPAKGVR